MGKEFAYISLQGVVFVPGDIDHKDFVIEFSKLMDSKGWLYQGKSRKITEEDLNGEKRD